MNNLFLIMTLPMYFNTVQLESTNFQERLAHANTQEQIVLEVYRTCGTCDITPSEVKEILDDWGFKWPLTSVRRAITNLTNEDRLFKTDHRRPGEYGHPTFAWQLKMEATSEDELWYHYLALQNEEEQIVN